MEGERLLMVGGVEYKCVFFYGYNNHYYVTVYNNEDGSYIGQLVDTDKKISDSELVLKISTLIGE